DAVEDTGGVTGEEAGNARYLMWFEESSPWCLSSHHVDRLVFTDPVEPSLIGYLPPQQRCIDPSGREQVCGDANACAFDGSDSDEAEQRVFRGDICNLVRCADEARAGADGHDPAGRRSRKRGPGLTDDDER